MVQLIKSLMFFQHVGHHRDYLKIKLNFDTLT